MLLGLGLTYASVWLTAEWHLNGAFMGRGADRPYWVLPWPERIDERVYHARKAKHLFPLERMYRFAPAFLMHQKLITERTLPVAKETLAEFRAAVAIDSTSTELLGRLLGLELDLDLKDDAERTFAQFRRVSKRGPTMKVNETGTPSPANPSDGKEQPK
jgi:hypothetical protein